MNPSQTLYIPAGNGVVSSMIHSHSAFCFHWALLSAAAFRPRSKILHDQSLLLCFLQRLCRETLVLFFLQPLREKDGRMQVLSTVHDVARTYGLRVQSPMSTGPHCLVMPAYSDITGILNMTLPLCRRPNVRVFREKSRPAHDIESQSFTL
jgi:hypothetical protein